MFHFYNTLTRQIEEFKPLTPDKVLFYHCGPTVYWTQHIGNLRGMTMGDILVRSLRYRGFEVTHVRNYTDVGHLTSDSDTGEDKMEKGAKREGKSPQEIAQKYIDIFEHDTQKINLLEPTFKPRPSELIPEIIQMIQTLIQKGYAYMTDLGVYYDVSKFPDYTKLSHQKIDMNMGGSGKGEVEDPQKRHFADFALWIFKSGTHVNALQTWQSPFHSLLTSQGEGFPGWHIECSVMTKKYLANTIDIHMGGVEHIPVHHTNEIAQSEAANGVEFVRYWLHNEHLVINNEKMAKSTGTGMTLEEIEKHGFDPLALRYFYLTAQYRTRQNFTWEALEAAQKSLRELYSQLGKAKSQMRERSSLSNEKLAKMDEYRNQFIDAIEDDLNIPKALAVAWEVVKSNIPPGDKYDLLLDFDEVLGLDLREGAQNYVSKTELNVPENITQLVKKRDELRSQKKFSESDAVRQELEKLGYIVEDTPSGTSVKKKTY